MGNVLLLTSLIVQYSIVGAILIGALIWSISKILKTRKLTKNGDNAVGCSNCQLAESCNKPKKLHTSNK